MRSILLLARREIAAYLHTAWGYAILASVLVIDGLMFNAYAMSDKARYSAEVLEDFFYFSSGTTMIAGLLLTMRLIAEERQTGTLVVLETAPISERQVVVGKYLGAMGFLSLVTALTIYMPILIQVNGKVSWAQIGAGYLGLFSIGAAVVAVGTFGSAVAKNQLLAAVIGGALTVLLLLGWLLGRIVDPPFSGLLEYVALFDRHFQPFMRGRINTESLVFYGSVAFGFLMLSVRVLEARRRE